MMTKVITRTCQISDKSDFAVKKADHSMKKIGLGFIVYVRQLKTIEVQFANHYYCIVHRALLRYS